MASEDGAVASITKATASISIDSPEKKPQKSSHKKPVYRKVNLDHRLYFPSFNRMPEYDDVDTEYMRPDPVKGDPYWTFRVHWCMIADINKVHSDQMIECIDREGEKFKFCFVDDDRKPFNVRPEFVTLIDKLSRDPTERTACSIAVLYGYNHSSLADVMSLTFGVFSEEHNFMVFPAKRQVLMDEIRKLQICLEVEKKCCVCDKGQGDTKACGRCKVAQYCSAGCQMDHWKKGHKKLCQHAKMLANFGKFNFGKWNKWVDWDYFRNEELEV